MAKLQKHTSRRNDRPSKNGRAGTSRRVSGASPTNSTSRRSRVEIQRLKDAIYATVKANRPCTVRQVYYLLVSAKEIDKTEGEYNSTVCRLLSRMRRDGDLPFAWIADNTRWMRKPNTYSSLSQMLEISQHTYRRAIWDNQSARVEIWLEKDALAGVLWEVTREWDVPLMVTRGYPSITFLHSSAEEMAESDVPNYLYYFGDWDPSGVDIPRKVERDLRQFAPGAEIHFERVAVNENQIKELNLPTRPTKKSDTRSKTFKGKSVEVDAIPPATLRDMARRCIEQHIDKAALDQLRVIEEAERETLGMVIDRLHDMDDDE